MGDTGAVPAGARRGDQGTPALYIADMQQVFLCERKESAKAVRVSMSGVRVPSECGHECVRKYPGVGDGVLA